MEDFFIEYITYFVGMYFKQIRKAHTTSILNFQSLNIFYTLEFNSINSLKKNNNTNSGRQMDVRMKRQTECINGNTKRNFLI